MVNSVQVEMENALENEVRMNVEVDMMLLSDRNLTLWSSAATRCGGSTRVEEIQTISFGN
jgi:hypothetical protein